MINELHMLSEAMREAEVSAAAWHREYIPIPNIKKDAPCFRLVLEGESVLQIEGVSAESGSVIRKFGNNQGSYPAMNLAPLYFISKEQSDEREAIQRAIRNGAADLDLSQIRQWCTVNNWDEKFSKKYRISMVERPKRLKELLRGSASFAPLLTLMEATQCFEDPQLLHRALEETCFRMLEQRQDMALALQLLFFTGKGNGNVSVILDTFDLEDEGWPTIGGRFTNGLNRALLLADEAGRQGQEATERDAFGLPFVPSEEPMPSVKLPAGFSVTLRTMFHGQPCQRRYRRIDNGSYPISTGKRAELKAAMEWVSAAERKKATWTSTGKDEALFVYPSRLHDTSGSYTGVFQQMWEEDGKAALFEAEAKRFTDHITKLKERDPEYCPDRIQVFFLRKLDKARTKVIYTRNTSPNEIIDRCADWRRASRNLPAFHFGQPPTPFPLTVTPILNRVWKLDGSIASDKFRAAQMYHGLELFFDHGEETVRHDLQMLVRSSENLAVYAGRASSASGNGMPPKTMLQLKETLALMGMLLEWTGSGKDSYMDSFPYLFGQLLKVSDSVHELYCFAVRDGQIPPQLVGGSMFAAAAEAPLRSFALLSERMMPYLNWARTHENVRLPKDKNNPESKEGPSAGYYRHIYRQLADKLEPLMTGERLTMQTRFTDAEKAQLFIGYLASFPRSEKTGNNTENTEQIDNLISEKGEDNHA